MALADGVQHGRKVPPALSRAAQQALGDGIGDVGGPQAVDTDRLGEMPLSRPGAPGAGDGFASAPATVNRLAGRRRREHGRGCRGESARVPDLAAQVGHRLYHPPAAAASVPGVEQTTPP